MTNARRTAYLPVLLMLIVAPFFAIPIGGGSVVEGAAGGSDMDSVRVPQQEYLWPTDASRKVTSTFAEYRSTHFHGGIDISTNGVKGYSVFAVRDGYVSRVRITPNGYGKMLFLTHDDGYVSTYAHLQGFTGEIARAVREEQRRRGTYAINLAFDRPVIRVKQGEVVARTGDSGFGPPHLHFEIRDENLNPVNPMLFNSYQIRDAIPPSIRRLMIAPLSYNSTVENGANPRYFSRFPRSRRVLTIPQRVRVHGLIGIGIDALDRSEGSWSKAGIHRMELYLDDSLTFAMEMNRVPAEQTKQIDLHYDYEAISRGRGHFQKLYIETGNVLPFYFHKPAGTGVINTEALAEGRHDYRVVCFDKSGNSQELRGTILANHRPNIKLLRADTDEIVLGGSRLESIERCVVYGKRAFQPNWTQHTLPRGRFEVDGTGIELPINTKPYDVVKVIAESRSGSESAPIFYFVKKPLGPPRDVHVESELRADHVRFTVTTPGVFTDAPLLTVQEGSVTRDVPLDASDVNHYSGAYIPTPGTNGPCVVRVRSEVNGKAVTSLSAVELHVIPADRAGSFAFDDGKLVVAFDSGAVFTPLILQVAAEEGRSATTYDLTPDDVLLNGGIRVSLAAAADGRQGALYFRTTAGWSFQGDSAKGGKLSTSITRLLGSVAVLHDDFPPSIGRLRFQRKHGAIAGGFRYFDNLSGVDPDEIKLYLDGTLIIPEIDGEHRRVWFESEGPLTRGRHLFKIAIKDRAGNSSELTRTLTSR